MKTSPAFTSRNSRYSTATDRPRVNGPISKLFSLYRGEFVLAQISPSPSDIFLHPLMILTLPLPLLSFSLKRHILHTSQSDGTWSPTGPLFFPFSSRSFHQLLPPVDTPSFVLRLRLGLFFFSSHSPLVIRSLCEEKKSHHSETS